MNTQRKCIIIESLMSLKQPITKINPQKIIERIPYDERIRTVSRQPSIPDIEKTRQKAASYTNKIINNLSEGEIQCIKTFYKDKKFKPDLLNTKLLHPDIEKHPGILRALELLQQES